MKTWQPRIDGWFIVGVSIQLSADCLPLAKYRWQWSRVLCDVMAANRDLPRLSRPPGRPT